MNNKQKENKMSKKLFQLSLNNEEKFCFNAKSLEEAENKKFCWCYYHGYDSDKAASFKVQEVQSPFYQNNIHNEWVK